MGFEQHIKRVAMGQGRPILGRQRGHQLIEVAPKHFKGRQLTSQPAIHVSEQPLDVIERLNSDQTHLARLGGFPQSQGQSSDNTEGALRAEKKLLQIITRIIFDQRIERIDDRAISKHCLHTQHHIPHHAVLQHSVSARVGRRIPAESSGTPRTEVERKHQPLLSHSVL